MNIWITSDTHFCHANSLNWTDHEGKLLRGSVFSSTEEMNETMIERWNSVVKPEDKVYHLGDVHIGPKETFFPVWKRLNGKKRVMLGNHDDPVLLAKYVGKDLHFWRIFSEDKIILTHVPLHLSNLQIYLKKGEYKEGDTGTTTEYMFNVHGHIHHNPSPEGPYFNASVENTNYTPINYEEVKQHAARYFQQTTN